MNFPSKRGSPHWLEHRRTQREDRMFREWEERTREKCDLCKGTGAIDAPTSADDPTCPECDGTGYANP